MRLLALGGDGGSCRGGADGEGSGQSIFRREDTPGFARGELTLVPGDPTVRINRQHSISLNLKLRVRFLSLTGNRGKCPSAAAGSIAADRVTRPIPILWRNDRPQKRWAGTR